LHQDIEISILDKKRDTDISNLSDIVEFFQLVVTKVASKTGKLESPKREKVTANNETSTPVSL